MFSLARVQLPSPVTITISANRSRVAVADLGDGPARTIAGFNACFTVNPVTLTIHAEMPPLPKAMLIYGPRDFAAAAADTPEQHAARVLAIVGATPQTYLQAFVCGTELPELPARVPRSVANWQAKALLGSMGLIASVELALGEILEPRRAVVLAAWHGNGRLYRDGETVQTISAALSLTTEDVDTMFIHAGALEV